jgi:RNA polymerase sigma factor (sigma-70 family)
MSNLRELTDDMLIEGCRRQEPLAQSHLYRRFFGCVMSICLRYANDRPEAVEITNSVFLKVFQKVDSYNPGSLRAWISKVAMYTCIDHVRHRAVYQRHISGNELPDMPIQNDAISHLSESELLQLIQQLPTASRTVFSLYVIEGFNHEEIARELNIPVGTSKCIFHKRGACSVSN